MKITVHYGSLSELLSAIQAAWNDGDLKAHSEASGFALAQLAMFPDNFLNSSLPEMFTYVTENGSLGIEGVLLSTLSATLALDSTAYSQAMGAFSGPLSNSHTGKSGFGLYFADVGGRLVESGAAFGPAVTSPQKLGKLRFSFGPDESKSGILGQALGGAMPGDISGFAGLMQTSTNNANSKLPPTKHDQLMSTGSEGCVRSAERWGYVGGFIAGGVVGYAIGTGSTIIGGPAGAAGGAGLVGEFGENLVGAIADTWFCGTETENETPETPKEPETGGGEKEPEKPTNNGESGGNSDEGGGQGENDGETPKPKSDSESTGVKGSGSATVGMPHPDGSGDGSVPGQGGPNPYATMIMPGAPNAVTLDAKGLRAIGGIGSVAYLLSLALARDLARLNAEGPNVDIPDLPGPEFLKGMPLGKEFIPHIDAIPPVSVSNGVFVVDFDPKF